MCTHICRLWVLFKQKSTPAHLFLGWRVWISGLSFPLDLLKLGQLGRGASVPQSPSKNKRGKSRLGPDGCRSTRPTPMFPFSRYSSLCGLAKLRHERPLVTSCGPCLCGDFPLIVVFFFYSRLSWNREDDTSKDPVPHLLIPEGVSMLYFGNIIFSVHIHGKQSLDVALFSCCFSQFSSGGLKCPRTHCSRSVLLLHKQAAFVWKCQNCSENVFVAGEWVFVCNLNQEKRIGLRLLIDFFVGPSRWSQEWHFLRVFTSLMISLLFESS